MTAFDVDNIRCAKAAIKNWSIAQWGKAYRKDISAIIHASELIGNGGLVSRRDASFIKVG